MMRAGIPSQRGLAAECRKIAPVRVGAKKDMSVVGKNLIWRLFDGRAKSLSFEQVNILCRALKCTPDELFGWKPVGDFSQADALQQLEMMNKKVERFSSILDVISKGETPVAQQVRKILQQS